ncbi:glycosyltransferase family 4 protein [Chloroflexota bacterium]
MKLLILTIEFPPGPGGIGTLSDQIAYNLSNNGWNVSVSTPQNFSNDAEIEAFNKTQPYFIQRLTYNGPFLFEAIDRFLKALFLIVQKRTNIILSVSEQATWLGAILAFLTKKPLVVIGIGTEFGRGNKLRQWITRISFNRADCIVAISDFTHRLMKELKINTPNMYVIHCGAENDIYNKDLPVDSLKKEFHLEQSKVILTVGQLSKRKAQDIVIQALPKIKQSFPEIKYLVVGIPKMQSEFEKYAYELGVLDSVIFVGQVPQKKLPYLYNLADVFVLVSRSTLTGDVEGFGIVVIEAALCGTPAVVSNNSGLEETVIDWKTGLIVEQEDPEATAAAIIELLKNDSLRDRMGDAAYNNAINNATWKHSVQKYEKILKRLIII